MSISILEYWLERSVALKAKVNTTASLSAYAHLSSWTAVRPDVFVDLAFCAEQMQWLSSIGLLMVISGDLIRKAAMVRIS